MNPVDAVGVAQIMQAVQMQYPAGYGRAARCSPRSTARWFSSQSQQASPKGQMFELQVAV